MAYRVGVDVGGTNTDACLMLGSDLVSKAKTLTSAEPMAGMQTVLAQVFASSSVGPEAVHTCTVGTTHFLNALVTCSHLARVAVLRLCGPATAALPPFCDMPARLLACTGTHYALLEGGFEYDGGQPISPVKESQVRAAVREALNKGVTSFVIAGVFSPVNASQEDAAAAILRDEVLDMAVQTGRPAPRVHVTLSHRVGGLGLLERENAAILNAALRPLAARLVPALAAALAAARVAAPLYLSGNDGTLLSADAAQEMPIATIQSGPVNSLRGAAFLSGLRDGIVIDIGGTTTDVGVLVAGLPRPAPARAQVAGVRTNFPLPDLVSTGLGGGSIVRCQQGDAPGAERCTIGPQSVGASLVTRALCMGGDTCTASDVAIALGRMGLGDAARVHMLLPQHTAQAAWQEMQRRLERCIDKVKTSADPVPVLVVGGAAALCGETLAGAASVRRPPHAEVANAVGAAIPQVSGSVDAIYQVGAQGEHRATVLASAEAEAIAQAAAAGADPPTCEVVVREELPLAYLPGGMARVRLRVVGQLAGVGHMGSSATGGGSAGGTTVVSAGQQPAAPMRGGAAGGAPAAQDGAPAGGEPQGGAAMWPAVAEAAQDRGADLGAPSDVPAAPTGSQAGEWQPTDRRCEQLDTAPAQAEDWDSYEPQVNKQGEWIVSKQDVEALTLGTGILGCGGGGSPYLSRIKLLHELDRGAVVRVVALDAVPTQGLVVDAGYMGAPTVGLEKLDAHQAEPAVAALVAAGGGAQLAALMAGEVGGGNGLEPLVMGARMGLPVVDADLMGRAFPELQMTTAAVAGLPQTPAALADEKGNVVVVQQAASPAWLERLLRPVCTAMGCSAGLALAPLTGAQLARCAVRGSLSLARMLGAAALAARARKQDVVRAVAQAAGGRVLLEGKVVDVQRATSEGFARGQLLVAPLAPGGGGGGGAGGAGAAHTMRILFQNENLLAYQGDQLVACVPDLICCLETEGGQPVQTEEMRYGLRVSVLAIPAHPLLTTPEALAVVGPAAFGHPEERWEPGRVGPYRAPQPLPRAPAMPGT